MSEFIQISENSTTAVITGRWMLENTEVIKKEILTIENKEIDSLKTLEELKMDVAGAQLLCTWLKSGSFKVELNEFEGKEMLNEFGVLEILK